MATKVYISQFCILSTLLVLQYGNAKKCTTSENDLDNGVDAKFPSNSTVAGKYTKSQEKWPNAVVPYKLHHSLNTTDKQIVQQAIAEFNYKTCVNIRPWQQSDTNFVSIEKSNIAGCGESEVCMQNDGSDYQFARFSPNCIDKATIVHELGHTICLGHEHERPDRNEYLSFENCPKQPRRSRRSTKRGIYDFDSQMGYACGNCDGGNPKESYGVTACAEQVNDGLSIMDVDTINLLYDCQGCKRHRWIPLEIWKSSFIKDLPDLDFLGKNLNYPLFACRAQIRNEILIGRFDLEERACLVPSKNLDSIVVVNKGVEVLVIPDYKPVACGRNFEPHYCLMNYWEMSPKQIAFHGVSSGKLVHGTNFRPATGYIELLSVNREEFTRYRNLEQRRLKEFKGNEALFSPQDVQNQTEENPNRRFLLLRSSWGLNHCNYDHFYNKQQVGDVCKSWVLLCQ